MAHPSAVNGPGKCGVGDALIDDNNRSSINAGTVLFRSVPLPKLLLAGFPSTPDKCLP